MDDDGAMAEVLKTATLGYGLQSLPALVTHLRLTKFVAEHSLTRISG